MKRFVWGIVLTSIGVLAIPSVFSTYSNCFGVVVFLAVGIPLLIVGNSARRKQKAAGEQVVVQQEETSMVSVQCPSCGASVKVPKGSAGKCEYCGSAVNGPE